MSEEYVTWDEEHRVTVEQLAALGYGDVVLGDGTGELVRIEGPLVDDLSNVKVCHWVGAGVQRKVSEDCPHICECGWFVDTFACKIRHVSVQTGWAKKDH